MTNHLRKMFSTSKSVLLIRKRLVRLDSETAGIGTIDHSNCPENWKGKRFWRGFSDERKAWKKTSKKRNRERERGRERGKGEALMNSRRAMTHFTVNNSNLSNLKSENKGSGSVGFCLISSR